MHLIEYAEKLCGSESLLAMGPAEQQSTPAPLT